MSRTIIRPFFSSLILAAVTGAACLLLFYVAALPTSDVRTRMYILIELLGWGFTATAFVAFALLGFCAVWFAGWRDRWSVVGVLVGSLVPLVLIVLIYSRVMGYAVWMHDEDMTTIGRVTRTAVALAVMAVVYRSLRADTGREAAA